LRVFINYELVILVAELGRECVSALTHVIAASVKAGARLHAIQTAACDRRIVAAMNPQRSRNGLPRRT
jgi:hypothetical protein